MCLNIISSGWGYLVDQDDNTSREIIGVQSIFSCATITVVSIDICISATALDINMLFLCRCEVTLTEIF